MTTNSLIKSVVFSVIAGFMVSLVISLLQTGPFGERGSVTEILTNGSFWQLVLILSVIALIPTVLLVWLVGKNKK